MTDIPNVVVGVSAFAFDPLVQPFVGDLLVSLDERHLETLGERSAILEFETGVSRPLAEALACIELLRHHPEILKTVTLPD